MVDYIDYNVYTVSGLKKIMDERNLQYKSKIIKPEIIEQLKNHDKKYKAQFDVLFDKYVPPTGSASTRAGKILRAANKLMYRYYNDGDSFAETIDEFSSVFKDLSIYDRDIFSTFSIGTHYNNRYIKNDNDLEIINMVCYIVNYVNKIIDKNIDGVIANESDSEIVYY